MVHKIILGRNEPDRELYGDQAALFIGKQYITMGKIISLANEIYLDVARPHVVLISGKRGSGKSYTMGVIVEAMAGMPKEVKDHLSAIIFDTMGIFWTMKYPNYRDEDLLSSWGLESKSFDDDVVVYVPKGKFESYKSKGLPVDEPFSIPCKEISSFQWANLFKVSIVGPLGILITRVITNLLEKGEDYGIDEIIEEIKNDTKSSKEEKEAVLNMFENVKTWGIFDKEGTPISKLISSGKVSVLDLSEYASMGEFSIRALIIGLISKRILEERIMSRKIEEVDIIKRGFRALREKKTMPQVWIFIDEAHEFLPKDRKTLATNALIQIIREGRQPGVSLVLATQQPGKIHADVITQSDIVISHRITAEQDILALNKIMQTYLLKDIRKYLSELPKKRGTALVLDDKLERIYSIQIRPRMSWHGGAEPEVIPPIGK